jgi:hypothetical protein
VARVVALMMALSILTQGSLVPLHPFGSLLPLHPLQSAGLAADFLNARDCGIDRDVDASGHDPDGAAQHCQCDDHLLYHMLALVPAQATLPSIDDRQSAPQVHAAASFHRPPPSPPPMRLG